MADRYPIVVINGELKELPSGDTIPAAAVTGNFLSLTDTPSAYTSQALKAVRVNAGETALEFYTPSGGITIGSTAISSGTVGRILFHGSGDVVAEDSGLAYDTSVDRLILGNIGIYSPTTYGLFIGVQPASLSGDHNTTLGRFAGNGLTSGQQNVLLGDRSGQNMTTGFGNIAVGSAALYNITTGSTNIGIGTNAMLNCITGSGNIALGPSALGQCTNNQNVGIGDRAGTNITTGYYNTCIGGDYAGGLITTGYSNTCIGSFAGDNLTTGANNVAIGASVDFPSATGSNQTNINDTLVASSTRAWILRSGFDIYHDGSNYVKLDVGPSGVVTLDAVGSGAKFVFSDAVEIGGSLTLSAQNIVTDTSTGMKIGTGTTQKLGFFNATPVTQRSNIGQLTDLTGGSVVTILQDCDSGGIADVSTINDNFAGVLSKINAVEQVLQDLGLTS